MAKTNKQKHDEEMRIRDIIKDEASEQKYKHENIFVHIKKRTLNCWLRALLIVPIYLLAFISQLNLVTKYISNFSIWERTGIAFATLFIGYVGLIVVAMFIFLKNIFGDD